MMSRNDLARQRQIEADAKKKVDREVHAQRITANHQEPHVRVILQLVSIPFLSVKTILTFLDNRSVVAYARVSKPIRASVIRYPGLLRSAIHGYHQECRQQLINSKLLSEIEREEIELSKYKLNRSKVSFRAVMDQEKLVAVLIKRLEKRHKFSYAAYKERERLRLESEKNESERQRLIKLYADEHERRERSMMEACLYAEKAERERVARVAEKVRQHSELKQRVLAQDMLAHLQACIKHKDTARDLDAVLHQLLKSFDDESYKDGALLEDFRIALMKLASLQTIDPDSTRAFVKCASKYYSSSMRWTVFRDTVALRTNTEDLIAVSAVYRANLDVVTSLSSSSSSSSSSSPSLSPTPNWDASARWTDMYSMTQHLPHRVANPQLQSWESTSLILGERICGKSSTQDIGSFFYRTGLAADNRVQMSVSQVVAEYVRDLPRWVLNASKCMEGRSGCQLMVSPLFAMPTPNIVLQVMMEVCDTAPGGLSSVLYYGLDRVPIGYGVHAAIRDITFGEFRDFDGELMDTFESFKSVSHVVASVRHMWSNIFPTLSVVDPPYFDHSAPQKTL